MKIVETDDGTLVVRLADSVNAWVGLSLLVGCSILAVVRYLTQPNAIHTEAFKGALAGAAFGLMVLLVFFERSKFVFDGRRQMLLWSRWRPLRRCSGVILRRGGQPST